MNIIVNMEIETEDYSGEKFMNEIEKLISDIDTDAKLIKFKMRNKYGGWDDSRDIEWREI